jgi:hypothetical protein
MEWNGDYGYDYDCYCSSISLAVTVVYVSCEHEKGQACGFGQLSSNVFIANRYCCDFETICGSGWLLRNFVFYGEYEHVLHGDF